MDRTKYNYSSELEVELVKKTLCYRVIPAGNFADDEASDEFLSIGTKDISKLVELCDMYQQKCPNEYKLEFDVATHKFDASYRYDDYTKSGISPVSELMSWYGEIKESM